MIGQTDTDSVAVGEIRPRCRRCGRGCPGRYELGWSRTRTGTGEWWLCGVCTRAMVPDIESGLDDR